MFGEYALTLTPVPRDSSCDSKQRLHCHISCHFNEFVYFSKVQYDRDNGGEPVAMFKYINNFSVAVVPSIADPTVMPFSTVPVYGCKIFLRAMIQVDESDSPVRSGLP